MDFIKGLPLTCHRHNTILVIVDPQIKLTHFVLARSTSTREELAELYIKDIVKLHGIPQDIVFNRGN